MDYAAEAFDQMQMLWGLKGFNDHTLRCFLRFKHRFDAETLKRAVIASIEVFPILGTRYIAGTKPRWTSLDPNDFDKAFVMAETEADFEEFVGSKVDESIGPQIRVCLLNSMPFSIALKINHMVCDATDFKAYIYFLCRVYEQIVRDPEYRPGAITGGRDDRSVRCILKRFSLGVRLKSLLLQSRENNLSGGAHFPLDGTGQTQPFILTRKLGRKRTSIFKDYGRANGATLNDVVLAVLYRCLFRRLALSPGAVLRIPVMVDMRRYLAKQKGFSPLTNLTSTVSTELEYRAEEGFEDTLRRVKLIMDQRKRSNPGLNGFIKLDRAYRIFGDRIANRLLGSMLKNPFISMTNMGILDFTRISLGGQRPCDAFLCGSIKYKPYFQLAMSSYDGELTLSVNLLGTDGDRDRIRSLFDELEAEMSGLELSRGEPYAEKVAINAD